MNPFKVKLQDAIANTNHVAELDAVLDAYRNYCDDLVNRIIGVSINYGGINDWLGYEVIIGEVNFEIIEPFLKNKKYKGKNVFLDGLLTMSLDKKYGKGRLTMIYLLQMYGSPDYATGLLSLLHDPQVFSWVINALAKFKDFTAYDEIKEIAENKKRIPGRIEARKYIKRMDALRAKMAALPSDILPAKKS